MSPTSAAPSPAPRAPRDDVHHGLKELSSALEIGATDIKGSINPEPLAIPQPGPTATSSISEKVSEETDPAAAAAPPRPSPSAVTTSASAQPTTGQARQRLRLVATDKSKLFLPGQPRIRLEPAAPSTDNEDRVLEYLRESHLTTELDGLLPYMKYIFVQTPAHKHIMPLHHQKAHGRDVILNEHPGLHLVWYYDRIFIKPIPAYMYSRAFWDYISNADPKVYQASLGFIRSYYYLIQFETDFNQACKIGLIPKIPTPPAPALPGGDADPKHPSYEEFCAFMESFVPDIEDTDVNYRFGYGELRLTRINKTTMFFKRKMAYFHMLPQWGSYLQHLLTPIITVFAILTVILNAMQVTLAAHEVGPDTVTDNWKPFVGLSLYLPVAVMILISILLAFLLGGVLAMGFKDLVWAKTVRHRRKHGNLQAGEKSYGVIW
ncbi:hypothetical protein RB597_000370 [Gaeumannomyces tritici]